MLDQTYGAYQRCTPYHWEHLARVYHEEIKFVSMFFCNFTWTCRSMITELIGPREGVLAFQFIFIPQTCPGKNIFLVFH